MKLNLIIGTILALVMTMTAMPTAIAGPDPANSDHFYPVKSMKEAEDIKPGAHIAMRCGKCGAVVTMIADKEQSYLHGFTCPFCKDKFVVRQDPHGGGHGAYVCEDESGHRADLLKTQE